MKFSYHLRLVHEPVRKSIKILQDFKSMAQQWRKAAKYFTSFLNSKEAAAQKCLRGIYKKKQVVFIHN